MGTEVKRKTEQQSQWDGVFNKVPDFFGHGPSEFGRVSLEIFKKEGVRSVLELGCGQGRDTFLFALHFERLRQPDIGRNGKDHVHPRD